MANSSQHYDNQWKAIYFFFLFSTEHIFLLWLFDTQIYVSTIVVVDDNLFIYSFIYLFIFSTIIFMSLL